MEPEARPGQRPVPPPMPPPEQDVGVVERPHSRYRDRRPGLPGPSWGRGLHLRDLGDKRRWSGRSATSLAVVAYLRAGLGSSSLKGFALHTLTSSSATSFPISITLSSSFSGGTWNDQPPDLR